MILAMLAIIGLLTSVYTYYVEQKLNVDPNYKPICDISDKVSCSRTFQSQYANLFLVSNALAGLGYYALILLLHFFAATNLLFYLVLAGCMASIGLAYILLFKVKSYCLLCITTYVVNFLMLLVVWGKI